MMNKELITSKIDNTIKIEFSLKNVNMNLHTLIDRSIIDIIYSVHKGDIIQSYILDHCDDMQKLKVVFTHLFKDIGMPHLFFNMDILKTTQDNNIVFNCCKNDDTTSIETVELSNFSCIAPIDTINVECNFNDIHTCKCTIFLTHEKDHPLTRFEPMMMNIFKKMFKKVKTFIEMSQ